MTFRNRVCILTLLTFYTLSGIAQNAPIGYWDSHLPYNSALGVATDGTTLYAICNQAFFTYNISSDELLPYSKVSGMSDMGMQCVAYDKTTDCVVLVYSNGNIDLFKNNTFYNIPDLKLKTVSENKKVFQVYTDDGLAYLGTTLGLLVIDLKNNNIYKSYQFSYNKELLPIKGFSRAGNFFYAITGAGLFKVDKDNPHLENFLVWQRIDSTDTFSSITSVNNTLFLSTKKKVFTINADTFHAIYTCDTFIEHIGPGNNSLLIGVASKSGGGLKIMDLNFGIIDSFDCSGASAQAVQLSDNSLWVALPRGGLKKRTGINQTNYFFPDGPSGPYSFDLYAFNKTLYIAHGGYNTTYSASGSIEGASYFSKGKWTYYKHGDFHPFDYTRDYVALAKDESTGTLYIGSYLNGLLIVNGDGTSTPVDETVFDGSDAYGPTVHQILSLALDHSNNLWITTMFAKHQLYVKTPDNIWDSFKLPHINYGGCVITDDSGQVWMGGSSADGLAVLNTNKTISDKTDDASFHIGKGAGFGNLPGTGVACLAKDKKNQIWAGTENGIAVFTNCIATNSSSKVCEATIPIANFGAHPGPLFEGRNVITIAVDGADRKWVGTHEGVWLLSPDGQNMIYNFTRDNSPLPSNNVQKITIDKATGDVYIGTDMGVVSYHSTATEGASNNQKAEVFPNPVPGGYTGTIAIRGLVTNADVRITDIDGQLVYRTKALGGQAVWSGRDYNGHRPQSGVYLFFVSDSDGKQTYTGKIVFIQ